MSICRSCRRRCGRTRTVRRPSNGSIPKGEGRLRPLGIPAVKDRIVQQAVRLVIEPIFEHEFADTSYGFRAGRGCHDALREVDRLIKAGYTHVVDADLQAYFDSIPHEALIARIEERISDGRVLGLIRGWLTADILKGPERWTPTQGSAQGAVVSPLLANIYLDPLDSPIQGLLRLHSRYGPLDRSTAQGGLSRKAPIHPVTRANRLPATSSTDNCLGGTYLHWCSAPSGRTVESTTGAVAKGQWGVAVDRHRRCLNPSLAAPFPVAARRTVRADFPHTALGQDLMLSPTEGRV
jgi:hypothetical protein